MEIKGFYISHAGDPEVGISGASWELNNGFYFENDEDLQRFKTQLREMFEDYCGEHCKVETTDEVEAMEAEFLKAMEESSGDFMPPDESLI